MAASSAACQAAKIVAKMSRLRDCEAHPPVTGFPLTNPTGRHFQSPIHLQDRARKSTQTLRQCVGRKPPARCRSSAHAMPSTTAIGRNRCIP